MPPLPFVSHAPVYNPAFTCYMVVITLNFSSEPSHSFFLLKTSTKVDYVAHHFLYLVSLMPVGLEEGTLKHKNALLKIINTVPE